MQTNRAELVHKIQEIINLRSANPADEIISAGEAMIKIGKALKQCNNPRDQRAVIRAVTELEK